MRGILPLLFSSVLASPILGSRGEDAPMPLPHFLALIAAVIIAAAATLSAAFAVGLTEMVILLSALGAAVALHLAHDGRKNPRA